MWTEKDVDEFLQDVASICGDPLPAHPVDSLVGPIPDLAKRYYQEPKSKVPFHRVQRLPCVLKCIHCETKIKSSWLSLREMGRAQSSLPFKVQYCTCRSHVISKRQKMVESKWRPFLEKANAYLRGYQPPTLNYLEHLALAGRVFDGNSHFLKSRWSINLNTQIETLKDHYKPIILKHLVYVDLGSSLYLEFLPQIQVESTLSAKDHQQIILHELVKHIQNVGTTVCRSFDMSEKYRDDIYPLLFHCSYYEFSYSLYCAKKNAIALAEMDGRRRDVTFKNTFKTTLEKLQTKVWQVSEPAAAVAEKEVPDNLWLVLKKLKKHTLTNHQLLSCPLGALADTIHQAKSFWSEHAEVRS